MAKKQKINYIYSETFKTNKENPAKEELKTIFNKKFFKFIMKKEKNIFNTNEK